MMRGLFGVAVALGLAAQPAQAAVTPEQESDLRCAVWAALIGGNIESPSKQHAFRLALAWFSGRYEAGTGIAIESAITPEYVLSLAEEDGLHAECAPRMQDIMSTPSVIPAQGTVTPEQESDLRCAVWAAMIGGNRTSANDQQAYGLALTWFSGRYEAGTGITTDQAMTPEYLHSLAEEEDSLNAECIPRMRDMGQRFAVWANRMSEFEQASKSAVAE